MKVVVEDTNLTNIANAIRNKNGSSDTYTPSQMSTAINNIPSGGALVPDWTLLGYDGVPQEVLDDFAYSKQVKDNWDSSQTSLNSKFSMDYDLVYMPMVDTSNATNMYSMFSSCINLKTIPMLNTSNVTDMQNMFYSPNGNYNLTEIPLFDTARVTSMYNMLTNCKKITKIPQFNTQNVTSMQSMCSGCEELVDVPVLNTSRLKYNGMRYIFSNCPNLSNESLNNIMRMCINATATTAGNKKLSVIGLSSAQATTCQSLSNWDDFVAAGWTTGY